MVKINQLGLYGCQPISHSSSIPRCPIRPQRVRTCGAPVYYADERCRFPYRVRKS